MVECVCECEWKTLLINWGPRVARCCLCARGVWVKSTFTSAGQCGNCHCLLPYGQTWSAINSYNMKCEGYYGSKPNLQLKPDFIIDYYFLDLFINSFVYKMQKNMPLCIFQGLSKYINVCSQNPEIFSLHLYRTEKFITNIKTFWLWKLLFDDPKKVADVVWLNIGYFQLKSNHSQTPSNLNVQL